MDRGFGRNVDNGKSQFLRKKKQEKAQLQRKEKERAAANKVVAVFRRNQQYRRFVRPFIADSTEKVQLILQKRRETPPEKYYKMISNVLYKMPFILQTLIFITDKNLSSYEGFVKGLVQAIVGNRHRNDAIKKTMDNKGFPYVEIQKLLRFSLLLFGKDPCYEQFIVQFVAEASEHEPDLISKNLKNDRVRSMFREYFIKGRYLPENQQLILERVILPLEQQEPTFSVAQFAQAVLQVYVEKPELYYSIGHHLFSRKVLSSYPEFKGGVQTYSLQLRNACRWLAAMTQKRNQQAWELAVPLYLHNRVIGSYESCTIKRIMETYLSRKLIDQLEEEDRAELIDRAHRSAEYQRFLNTLNLTLYFGELQQLFKRELGRTSLRDLRLRSAEQQATIRLMSELYLTLSSIFRDKHNCFFEQFRDKGFLMVLLDWFEREDFSLFEFKNLKNEAAERLLELFVNFMFQRTSSADDVEFVQPSKGLTPNELQRIVTMLNSLIRQLLTGEVGSYRELEDNTIRLLNDLYHKNFRTKMCKPNLFEMASLSESFRTLTFDKGSYLQKLLKAIPFALDFEDRLVKLRTCIKQDKKDYDRELYVDEQHDQAMTIEVRRGYEFNDAFQQCYKLELRNKYIVVFTNQGVPEHGIDGGGIIKEFLNRVIKTAFDPLYGLFVETPLREIIPAPVDKLSPDRKKEYEFIGMIVGKAIYENIQIEAKFSGPFLNQLVGRENGLEDLRSLDPELYRSLISLKHSTEDISQLSLTFSFMENGKIIQLKENGSNISVTNENKLEFLMAYADFKMNKQLEQQSRQFRKGLVRVLKRSWLEMFNHDQLNLMISGKEADFDIKDLMKNTVYNGYNPTDTTIQHFWEILKTFTTEEKSLLLLFATSCSRPPTLGFSELKPRFCIAKSQQTGFLPTAHTCMNLLRLPNYQNKQKLRQKLVYAINAKAGFEFV